jgi:O-antigen ligase
MKTDRSLLNIITRYSIYFLLIFTPLARGSVQGWAVTVIHMGSLITLTAFILEKCFAGKCSWIKTPLDKPILVLTILIILSSIFSVHPGISFRALVLYINYFVVFYIVVNITKSRKQLISLIYIIIGVGVFLSFFGLFKRFGFNPFQWWAYGELSYPKEMLSSTYGNHNHLAGYLEMAIPLALMAFIIKRFNGGKLYLMIYLVFIMIIAFILTLSRGGWISFTVGMIFLGFVLIRSRYINRKNILYSIMGGAIILILVILVSTPVAERIRSVEKGGEEASLSSRIMVWGGVLNIIKEYPLLGSGPGTFKTINTQYQPPGLNKRFVMAHNDYLHLISETGLILIPIITWIFVMLYREALIKIRNSSRLIRGATLGAITGITSILVHSIIDFNLHIPANAFLFSVFIAIIVRPLQKNNEIF